MCVGGANHTRPPILAALPGPLQASPSAAAFTPTPMGLHAASKTTIWLIPVAGRQGPFWGSRLPFSGLFGGELSP